jgi:hypothetical protein
VVMRSRNVVADDADGAGAEGGRRPTAVPAPCAATEMSGRPSAANFYRADEAAYTQ